MPNDSENEQIENVPLNLNMPLIGINLPGRNLPIFEKGGKFLPGNLKHGQVMERRLKKKS